MTYAQYFDLVGITIKENNSRITAKFKECETYVHTVLRKDYPECEIIYTKHEEDIKAGRFYVYLGRHYGHRFYKFSDCGIAPIDLVPFPARPQ